MNEDFVSKAYHISTDKSKLNLHVIHKFLSEDSYWSKNIPIEIVKKVLKTHSASASIIMMYKSGLQE